MAQAGFELERLRLEEAHALPASCFDDFQRLVRTLVHGPAFQWLLVDAADERLRQQVLAALDKVLIGAGLRTSRLPLGRKIVDIATLEQRLIRQATTADVVHVFGPHGWFDAKRWDEFNVRRERLASRAPARLVFWLDAEAIALASRGAPDLWAWRSGVYVFSQGGAAGSMEPVLTLQSGPHTHPPSGVDGRSMAERHRRIAEIRGWLAAHPHAPADLMVAPLDELGRLLFDLGDYDGALLHWQQLELPFHRRRGAEREVAITMGKIADILQARGQLDEALRIRKEEQLPVYERLGDVREKAVTMGQIADILQARGQLEEALRIRKEEELPVYERLGDVRSRAITQVKIAMLLLRMALRRHEAESLLREAHVTLAGMGLPEAKQVSELMRQHGVWP